MEFKSKYEIKLLLQFPITKAKSVEYYSYLFSTNENERDAICMIISVTKVEFYGDNKTNNRMSWLRQLHGSVLSRR